MEPIGGLASIVALGGTALAAAKMGIRLARILRDAPKDLLSVFAKVHLIQTHLDHLTQIGSLIDSDDDQLLSSQFKLTVQSALDSTTKLLLEIQEALPSGNLHEPKSRIRWALLDRHKLNKLTRQLPSVQQELGLALQILDMRIALHLKDSLANMNEIQMQLVRQVSHVQQSISDIHQRGTILQEKEPIASKADGTVPKRKIATDRVYQEPLIISDRSWLKKAGLSGTVASYLCDEHIFYAITLAFNLPWGSGGRSVCMEFMLNWYRNSAIRCQLSHGSLSIKPLVPIDSKIMIACGQGDVPTVQKLFCERKASSNDTTSCGRTPLMHAIKSGNYELVKFLIEAGADVNCSYGEFQMSPLQLAAQRNNLDMIRLLLFKHALAEHTDAQGWTAAFYLWSTITKMPNQSDILKVLSVDGGCEMGAVGQHNWTALHRAAAFGTADDVRVMLQHGADTQVCTDSLAWNPLHYATLYGNESVICELLRPEYRLDVNSPDRRGWTPIHIAASLGMTTTLCVLLKLGANTHGLTKPTSLNVPTIFQGKELTPQEIAAGYGSENLDKYLQALTDSSLEADILGEKASFRDFVEI